MKTCGRYLAAITIMLLFSTVGAFAQTSSLTGQVSDPLGAKIVGAQVTITDVNTGVRTNALTKSDGTYEVRALQPGHYDVQVNSEGFSSFQQTGVLLEVDT